MPLEKQSRRELPKTIGNRYARFGDFIRAKREEFGLSQEEVANYCLVSRTQITNLEKGRFAPSFDLVFRLAEAFEYEDRLGDFFTDAGYTGSGL